MQRLRPSELAAILSELGRQRLIEEYNEQRNHWNFLAAVTTNGVSVLSGTIAGAFGRRRKPKLVEPDDFVSKDAKKLFRQLLGRGQGRGRGGAEQAAANADWSKHIEDAKAKGLRGPWISDEDGEEIEEGRGDDAC